MVVDEGEGGDAGAGVEVAGTATGAGGRATGGAMAVVVVGAGAGDKRVENQVLWVTVVTVVDVVVVQQWGPRSRCSAADEQLLYDSRMCGAASASRCQGSCVADLKCWVRAVGSV